MSDLRSLPRRSFLAHGASLTGLLLAGGLLSGCGGGGGGAAVEAAPAGGAPAEPVVVAPAPASTLPGNPAQRANLVLNVEYLAAQFHSFAGGGGGLPAALTGGVGSAGVVVGARIGALGEAAFASELAADKVALIGAAREAAGASAAAMPAIDLSAASGGAFARGWSLAGLSGEAAFDPYASDRQYLLGALLLHYGRAAAYRSLLDASGDGPDTPVLARALADATYHDGLIDARLDAVSGTDATLARWKVALLRGLVALDRSVGVSAALGETIEGGADVTDGADGAIAFVRTVPQLAGMIFLTANVTRGGFLPDGLNLGR